MKSLVKDIIKQYLSNKNQLYLLDIPKGLLFWNWFHQRILRINGDAKCSIHYTSKVDGFNNIKIIGEPSSVLKSFAVSGGYYIGVAEGTILEIGEGTIWAFNINIQTSDHNILGESEILKSNIKIGKNCWIAGNVTITRGVELGDNVIVGANSVVTKSFPSNVVIGGCPAKIIKSRTII